MVNRDVGSQFTTVGTDYAEGLKCRFVWAEVKARTEAQLLQERRAEQQV